jgi:hypothetical protein
LVASQNGAGSTWAAFCSFSLAPSNGDGVASYGQGSSATAFLGEPGKEREQGEAQGGQG